MPDQKMTSSGSSFYNEWVNLKNIPQAGEEEFLPLDGEYLYVRLARVLIVTVVGGLTLLLFVVMTRYSFMTNLLIMGFFGLLMSFWTLITILEFRHRGYAIREKDIAYRSGYLFRYRQYIPFRRVQHCKISEGPAERLFNFATVIVSAAGDDIVIHGLRPEEALSLQQWVNEKVDRLTKEMHYEEE